MSRRLISTPNQKMSLEAKRLAGLLAAVRGRVEAYPALRLDGRLREAQNNLDLLKLNVCAEKLAGIDQEIARHEEGIAAAEMKATADEQDRLLAERGTETFEAGATRTRDGWRWLTSRKPARLTGGQIKTGDELVELFAALHRDGLTTSANDNGCGEPTPRDIIARAERNHDLRQKVGYIRSHIEYGTGSDRLFGLVEAVCGQGITLRSLAAGDDRKALKFETELCVALDMARVAVALFDKAGEVAA